MILLRLMRYSIIAVSLVLIFTTCPLSASEKEDIPLQFYYESYDVLQFDTLLAGWDYDELAMQGKTEFEKMRIVMDWVYSKIYFYRSFDPKLKNSIQILRLAEEGKPFYCTNLAAVFLQCAQSLGWTARYIGVYSPLIRVTHTLNDIWSDQYRKWIFMDPTYNIYFECNGIPQSTYELRQAWLADQGANIEAVFGVGDKEQRWMLKDLPLTTSPDLVSDYQTWISGKQAFNNAWRWWPLSNVYLSYFVYESYLGRNNFFTSQDSCATYIMLDAYNQDDTKWTNRDCSDIDDPRILYHDLNRTDIIAEHQGGYSMNIKLDAFGSYNYTPNFQEFQVSIDNGPWKVKPASFTWKYGKGHHKLRARIVNKFGVKGAVTILSVDQADVKDTPKINSACETVTNGIQ